MISPESVFSQFVEDWTAGRRPRVEDFLARVKTNDRDELAKQITTFVAWAPSPDFEPETLAEMRADPVLAEVRQASEHPAGRWPSLLPRLRERANLERRELAQRVVHALGLGVEAEAKTTDYLEAMEEGTLDPRGVSQRVLDALGSALGVSGSDLAESGDFGLAGARPAAALYRAAPMAIETLRDFADAAHEPTDYDEVDELFRGGRSEAD